jgi:hypothetical protein
LRRWASALPETPKTNIKTAADKANLSAILLIIVTPLRAAKRTPSHDKKHFLCQKLFGEKRYRGGHKYMISFGKFSLVISF